MKNCTWLDLKTHEARSYQEGSVDMNGHDFMHNSHVLQQTGGAVSSNLTKGREVWDVYTNYVIPPTYSE